MINDHNNRFLIGTIFLNNRLNAYACYITEAINAGYTVEPLGAFHKHYGDNERHFVLRHDVDHNGVATRKMFECEKALGVKSTYYFRKSTIDKPLIDEMIQSGFEVGFHYETIANYCEEKNVNEDKIDLVACREMLKREIEEFENTIGHRITSICSHGSPGLHISNNALVEDGIPEGWTVEFEAYEKAMYDHVDCHIMDCSILNNYGFAYRDTPSFAIREGKTNIIFLAHPSHWYLSAWDRLLKLRELILGRATYGTERVFKRVAN